MPVMPGRITSARLVGREQELKALVSALDVVRETHEPRVVLVGGEAGVGKSRLVGDFISQARDSAGEVLIGHCVEISQGDLPFAPIIEAFREALYSLPVEERERVLGRAGHELVRMLPDLDIGAPETESVDRGTFGQGRFFELLSGILDRLGEGSSTLLVVEDLHWADSSTRDFLGFLARSIRSASLLLIATYRSDELHRRHPLRPFLSEIARLPRVETVELPRLSRQGVIDQAIGILGEPPSATLLDRIFDLSEGNPFFVEELIAAGGVGAASLPHSVRDALMLRLDTVTEKTQEVLRVAAVAGREVHHRVLQDVVDVDTESLNQALREAIERHLLVADRDTYSFRHALLREAVYGDLLPGERTELHRAFAETLGSAPELARSGVTAAAELAYHYHEARDLPAALRASLEAGGSAERTYGFAEAQRHYERVLELWRNVPHAAELVGSDEVEILRLAANAAYSHGDLERAVSLIYRALELIDPVTDSVRAGMAQERLGRYLWVLGRTEDAHIAHRAAVDLLPSDPPSAERARVLAGEAQILMLDARFAEAMSYAEDAIGMAREVGATEVLGHALNTLGVAVAYRGDTDLGIRHLLESRAIAEETGNYDDIGRSYTNLAEVYAIARRFDDAIADYREAFKVDERLGIGGTYGVWHYVDLAHILLPLGRWDEAEELLREVAYLPFDQVAGMMEIAKARLATWRGRIDVAAAALESARQHLEFVSQPQGVGPLHVTEAELALWNKRPLDARAAVAQGLEKIQDSEEHAHAIVLCWIGTWAEADIATEARATRDDTTVEKARAIAEQLAARANGLDDFPALLGPPAGPWAEGALPTMQAELARLRGDADPDHWRRAAQAWDDLGDPFRAAYCRWRLAEVLLIAGDRNSAVDELRRAQDAAQELDAHVLLDEIAALATRGRITLEDEKVGAPGVEEVRTPVEEAGLTAREIEVLKLVTAGMTNAQIAESLFISQKTVSVHVSHILEKFGVSSRVEAAGVAHRLGLSSAHQPK